MSFFISGPNVPPCDIYRPLRSSIGVGPRGESITVEEVDGDPYGCYRLEFKTESGSSLLTTPNIDPGSRVYVCNKNFDSLAQSGVYVASKTDFSSNQPSSIDDIRVGDIVIFNVTDSGIGYIGIGVVDSVGSNGSITFHRSSFIHDGSAGQRGPAGVSPLVTVTDIDTGVRISVTDESGTTTAEVIDGAHWYPGVDDDYVHVHYYDSNGDPDDLYLPTISGGSGESGVSGGKIDSDWLPIAGNGVFGAIQLRNNAARSVATITSSDGSINVPTIVAGEPSQSHIEAQYLPLATSESRGAISAVDKGKLDNIGSDYIVTSAAMVLENVGEPDDDWRQRVKLTVAYKNSNNEWEEVTYYFPYAATASDRIQDDMLPDSGVVAGSYGSSSATSYYIPTFTVDAHGRITQASSFFLGVASEKSCGLMSIDQYNDVAASHRITTTINAGGTGAHVLFNFVGVGRTVNVMARDELGNPIDVSWYVEQVQTYMNMVVSLAEAQSGVTYITVVGNVVAVSK